MNKNIAKDEMIVTLKEAAKEEWSEFTEKLQEAFAVAVEEKYGPLNGEKLPSDAEMEAALNAPKTVVYHIMSGDKKVGGTVLSIDEISHHNSLDLFFIYKGQHGMGLVNIWLVWNSYDTDFLECKSDKVNEEELAAFSALYGLSDRETEIVRAIYEGKRITQIAEELQLSENTVRVHNYRLYKRKLRTEFRQLTKSEASYNSKSAQPVNKHRGQCDFKPVADEERHNAPHKAFNQA